MTAQPKPKTPPHVRLTAEDLLELWRAKAIRCDCYVWLLILSLKSPSWGFHIASIKDFCEQWEIPIRTFNRAKAKLITEGKLSENSSSSCDLQIIERTSYQKTIDIQKQANDDADLDRMNSSTEDPTIGQIWPRSAKSGQRSAKSGQRSAKSGQRSAKSGRSESLEAPENVDPGDSPDLIQIYSDLSQSHPPTLRERDQSVYKEQENLVNDEALISFIGSLFSDKDTPRAYARSIVNSPDRMYWEQEYLEHLRREEERSIQQKALIDRSNELRRQTEAKNVPSLSSSDESWDSPPSDERDNAIARASAIFQVLQMPKLRSQYMEQRLQDLRIQFEISQAEIDQWIVDHPAGPPIEF